MPRLAAALGLGSTDRQAVLDALDRSNAVIEFDLDGTIVTANENFLRVMGYTLEEIKGKHHSIFVSPADRSSDGYRQFWDNLRRGVFQSDQFQRITKHGQEVWIEASYNPILDRDGKPVKVVKFATDVTTRRTQMANLEGQVNAIRKSQAVIEFELDGTIIDANQNFLDTLGYSLGEIRGKHHRMFVEPAYASSAEYQQFWDTLRTGQFLAAQYKRIGKGGKEIWIEASYNPILDANGRPYKVVKFATDISGQVKLLHDLKNLIDLNFGEIDQAIARAEEQTTLAARNASDTLTGVQMVAAGAEEMSASVTEISHSMTISKESADRAHEHTTTAGDATGRLVAATAAMGGIVEIIQDIAGQINLLALNATIESARAGEAGRGFAVVANEVKNLAKQAADATDQITHEIESVRSVSDEVATALGGIQKAMAAVLESVTTTATAVEEQTAVTRSIAASMNESSTSVDEISRNVEEITAAVGQVKQSVSRTRSAAEVLTR